VFCGFGGWNPLIEEEVVSLSFGTPSLFEAIRRGELRSKSSRLKRLTTLIMFPDSKICFKGASSARVRGGPIPPILLLYRWGRGPVSVPFDVPIHMSSKARRS